MSWQGQGASCGTQRRAAGGRLLACTLPPSSAPARLLPARYRATFKADPADCKPFSKTGGGYWFQERLHASAACSQPFLGTSTYRWEVAPLH